MMKKTSKFQIGRLWKGKRQPLSVRKKRSIKLKELWLSGKWKPWNKGRKLSERHRGKLKASNILAYRSRNLRKKVGKAVRKAFLNAGIRKKIDKSVTRYYREHPHARKERAERVIKYFKSHPLAFEKFLKAGKNPLKRHLRTKSGVLVRSDGERKIADWLFSHNINAEYESTTLFLDGFLCTPDFWLPEHKIYIEFYGGYPGSWKKKVIKNKLYKKFKIPVIRITPSELEYLDREFGQLKRK